MSEYQCYEFVALDRPLTPEQMDELRAISTRAEISPTRFWNEYSWGDLKADPAKLVERYFDAHLYFANWGTHRLMLRIPATRVDAKGLARYFPGDAARMRAAGGYLVLDLHSEDEEPDYDEPAASLAALAQVRAELMRGDLRAAYLAWLLGVQAGDFGDEAREPPVPQGLSKLTAAQEAMAEFLRIDQDLILAAAETSEPEFDDRAALRKWVLALGQRAKDDWLSRAIDDPDLAMGGELLRAFRAETKPSRAARLRTVSELRGAAERHRDLRERARVERAEKAKRAADAARKKRLDALAKRGEAAWVELEALVASSAYEEATKLAVDLRELARREGAPETFAAPFEALRRRQIRRRGFFDRWKRASESRRP